MRPGLYARLFPDAAPATMPRPSDAHWSEAWARRWLAWFNAAIADEDYADDLAAVTLLVLVTELLERGGMRVRITIDGPDGPESDTVLETAPGALCEENRLFACLIDPRIDGPQEIRAHLELFAG